MRGLQAVVGTGSACDSGLGYQAWLLANKWPLTGRKARYFGSVRASPLRCRCGRVLVRTGQIVPAEPLIPFFFIFKRERERARGVAEGESSFKERFSKILFI